MKLQTKNPATLPKSGVSGENTDLLYVETSITDLEPQKQGFYQLNKCWLCGSSKSRTAKAVGKLQPSRRCQRCNAFWRVELRPQQLVLDLGGES